MSNKITKNIVQTIGLEDVKLAPGMTGYWGIEPVKEPTIAMLVPIMKIKDFIEAKINMSILLADMHAYLRTGETLDCKTSIYNFIIECLLTNLGVDNTSYEIVKGSDVQLDRKYIIDLYKFMSLMTVNRAKNAMSSITKFERDPKVSSIIYPMMQVLDETIFSANVQLIAKDQAGICRMSRDYATELGHVKCAYILYDNDLDKWMNVNFVDTCAEIKEKVEQWMYVPKNINKTLPMLLAKNIIYGINRQLGDYITYNDLEMAWISGQLVVDEFKRLLAEEINDMISGVREMILASNIINNYETAFNRNIEVII